MYQPISQGNSSILSQPTQVRDLLGHPVLRFNHKTSPGPTDGQHLQRRAGGRLLRCGWGRRPPDAAGGRAGGQGQPGQLRLSPRGHLRVARAQLLHRLGGGDEGRRLARRRTDHTPQRLCQHSDSEKSGSTVAWVITQPWANLFRRAEFIRHRRRQTFARVEESRDFNAQFLLFVVPD